MVWLEDNFISLKQSIIDIRHKDRNDVQEVQTLQIPVNALQNVTKEMTNLLVERLQTWSDLVAEETV